MCGRDLFGRELDEFMRVKARGLARITAIIEAMPNIDNRVELAEEKDEFGMPLARVVHSYDRDVHGLWDAAIAEGEAIAKARRRQGDHGPAAASARSICSAALSWARAAENSVVNSYGQSHELANLYVAGCGIFPTESAANPTFTLNALSLRGAEQLAGAWGSVAG